MPKKRSVPASRIAGVVKWFDADEEWGVIAAPELAGDCFVHFSDIQVDGYRALHVGQRVQFTFEEPGFLQDGWLPCPAYPGGMEFAGFPADAFTFYEQLQVDNSKAFWIAHKSEYEQYVLRPIIALGEELEEEFGVASVFRPYRDIRFSADKSPYKTTYQGMFVERAPGLGFYAGISADGVLASGGFHSHAPDQIERYRQAVDAESSGRALAEVASGLASDGLAVEGDQMKTRPRGIPADHPRVELLRHRSLTGSRTWPPGPQLYSRDALGLVRDTWRQLVPLCNWLAEHVGGPRP